MKFVYALVVLTLVITGREAIQCSPELCGTCAPLTEQDCIDKGQVFVLNGGFCGCCSICATVVGRGEICYSEELRGFPPTSICEEGSSCQTSCNGTWTCQENENSHDRHLYDLVVSLLLRNETEPKTKDE